MRPEHESEYCDYAANRLVPMRRFAYLVCGDWHRAEDAVQNAFVKLYLAWARAQRADSLDAYTRRIVLNCVKEVQRRHWFTRERSTSEPPDRAATGDTGSEERRLVLDALAQLPMRRRATLVLRYWEDLSVEQTARVLRCSPATVKSQTVRGLRTLRGLLTDSFREQIERT
ncbi:SigE family RNA polymerase sigma factor [Stackebrandtia nassauensis]|uniref:RNA polymerase, sigma-24 subunit, ECF subfamily n=1 Tax=Stackebrandtia nassauensis (strain DSM 44728 / CIP 108903 / NRRL B-16338 / NBRC 102104 / LLR-40K-21) TaxID=446470 RepID=D3PYS5_STANL|nr:SigE family RNA polymerase sigma factor [Stackebrandtia nassauensis]ADD43508.1 RNA polymerase, sigma-24 subunit, ECF subfamily [Stackebrandtia nassauensis DSM 44728]